MKSDATKKQRDAIPSAIKRLLTEDYRCPYYKFVDNKLTVYVRNFNKELKPLKFTIKITKGKKYINSYIYDSEENSDFTKKLAIELYQCLNKKDKYINYDYILNGNVYEDNDEKHIKIFFYSSDRLFSFESATFSDLLYEYQYLKELEIKKKCIGGLRSYILAYRNDLKTIFNSDYVEALITCLNDYDFSHPNLKGEQFFDKKQNKQFLSKNNKLKNLSRADWEKICDKCFKKIDSMYKFLEIENKLR